MPGQKLLAASCYPCNRVPFFTPTRLCTRAYRLIQRRPAGVAAASRTIKSTKINGQRSANSGFKYRVIASPKSVIILPDLQDSSTGIFYIYSFFLLICVCVGSNLEKLFTLSTLIVSNILIY